jgi:hypothetical protein
MSPKGRKKSKGEGNTSDRTENITEEDDTGQSAHTLSIRNDLTPTMTAFEQGELYCAQKTSPFIINNKIDNNRPPSVVSYHQKTFSWPLGILPSGRLLHASAGKVG